MTEPTEEDFINCWACEHVRAEQDADMSRDQARRFLAQVRSEAWYQGESDGRWNAEHEAQIARGSHPAISDPYEDAS